MKNLVEPITPLQTVQRHSTIAENSKPFIIVNNFKVHRN